MEEEQEQVINVCPVGDIVEHILSPECWCVPRVEHLPGGTLIVHNSADGREYEERGEILQ